VRFDGRLEGCSTEKIEGLTVALSHTCQTGRCVSPSRRPVHRIHLTALTRNELDSCTIVFTLLVHLLHLIAIYVLYCLNFPLQHKTSVHSSYKILLSFPLAMHLPYNVTRERPLNVEPYRSGFSQLSCTFRLITKPLFLFLNTSTSLCPYSADIHLSCTHLSS
jgi:hypothetical protein